MSTNKQPAPWQTNPASQPETAPTETVSAEREPATTRLPQAEPSSDTPATSSSTQNAETDSSESHRVEANLEAVDASEASNKRRSRATMAWGLVGVLAIVFALLAVFGVVAQHAGWFVILLVLPAIVVFGWMIFVSSKEERSESSDKKRNPLLGLLALLIVFVVLLIVLTFSQMAIVAFTALLSLIAWLAGNITLARIIFVIVVLALVYFAIKRRAQLEKKMSSRVRDFWHSGAFIVIVMITVVCLFVIMPFVVGTLFAFSGIILPPVLAFAVLVSYGVFVMSDEADKKAWIAMAITLIAWFLLLGMSDFSV